MTEDSPEWMIICLKESLKRLLRACEDKDGPPKDSFRQGICQLEYEQALEEARVILGLD